MHDKLVNNGIEVISEPVLSSEGIAIVFFCLDPDGVRVELVQIIKQPNFEISEFDFINIYLRNLVDRIIVNYDGSNIHKLRLIFKIPYVNDEIIWKDKTNKKFRL